MATQQRSEPHQTKETARRSVPEGRVARLLRRIGLGVLAPHAGPVVELVQTILWAGVIAITCRVFFFQPFNIPSGSMLPTLKIGDYLFVSKFSYGYGKYSFPFSPVDFSGRLMFTGPERGDVAVFRKPTEPDIDYIKRVVGLPGDRIQVIGGVLHINGAPVKLRRDAPYVSESGERLPARVDQYTETLPNGVSHPIIEAMGARGWLDNTVEFTVPSGHYFMMGDNRDNSSDSRVLSDVGYVPVENFIGKAAIIFFSIGSDGIRFGRLFDVVE